MKTSPVATDNAPVATDSDFGVPDEVFSKYDTDATADDVTADTDSTTETPVDGAAEAQAVVGDDKALTVDQAIDPESIVELTKEMSLKIGDKLTAEHINEIKRGAFRNADYTRKTQQVADRDRQAQEVLQTRDAIQNDPSILRQHFNDDHILSAFNPQEILMRGLESVGIPPDAWNSFLDQYQGQNGAQPNAANWQANPLAKEISEHKNTIKKLESRLQNFETGMQRGAEQREFAKQTESLKTEIASAVKKYPDVTEEEILEAMAAGRQGTTDQVAAYISNRWNQRISKRDQALLEQKQRQQQTAPKGTSVPVLPQKPRTWEESEQVVAARLAGESLT